MVDLAAVFIKLSANGPDSMLYICTDRQGSITALVRPNGTVAEKYSYDAWGRRRNPANWADYNVKTPRLLNRGYTGHEMLDAFGLINMNGRMYDPVIGRILSPDKFVQSPTNTQSYNRYSYCFNNPLKYTDPTGWIAPECDGPILGGFDTGFGPGAMGGIGPGSGNHWSDAVRSEYGNYMLMSSNTFDTRYGDGASAIAGQLMSDPAAFTKWQQGLTSVDKIQEAGGYWAQQAYTTNYSGPGSITLNGIDYKIQPATGGVANKWISVNGGRAQGQWGGTPLPLINSNVILATNIPGSVVSGAASMTSAEIIRDLGQITQDAKYFKIGGNIVAGGAFVLSAYNVVAKTINGNVRPADILDMAASTTFLTIGIMCTNPITLGILTGVAISYGVLRITKGDEADKIINEKFGFNN